MDLQTSTPRSDTSASNTPSNTTLLTLHKSHIPQYVIVYPHLYMNANDACGTEAKTNECQKMVCLEFAKLNIHLALRTYFPLKYRLQTDSIRLFTERSPHKRMLFTAPWIHVHINISLNFASLIRHLRTDVDAA